VGLEALPRRRPGGHESSKPEGRNVVMDLGFFSSASLTWSHDLQTIVACKLRRTNVDAATARWICSFLSSSPSLSLSLSLPLSQTLFQPLSHTHSLSFALSLSPSLSQNPAIPQLSLTFIRSQTRIQGFAQDREG